MAVTSILRISIGWRPADSASRKAYSTARCGPSRSCLLTGYYAQQTASDVMTPGNIPDYTRFLPEYLKPLGYRSYHSGKWHMSFVTGEGGVGFDHSYTMLDELRFFTQSAMSWMANPCPSRRGLLQHRRRLPTTAFRFLKEHAREHANDPFFLYLAFHSPHFPLQAPPEDIEKYENSSPKAGTRRANASSAHASHGPDQLRARAA